MIWMRTVRAKAVEGHRTPGRCALLDALRGGALTGVRRCCGSQTRGPGGLGASGAPTRSDAFSVAAVS